MKFGKRVYNPSTGEWPVQWDSAPYNVVKVTARRTGSDTTAPDGEFPLAFGWAIGKDSVPLQTSATAFMEARDLVLVLDFSASMNDDSSLNSTLPIEPGRSRCSTACGIRSWRPTRNGPARRNRNFPAPVSAASTRTTVRTFRARPQHTILSTLGLNTNVNGHRKYPFPQAGRNSDGSPKSKPSNSTSDTLWNGYIDWVKNHSDTTYKKRYGYRTLMDYLEQKREDPSLVGRSVAHAPLPVPRRQERHFAVPQLPERLGLRRRSRLRGVRPMGRAAEDVLRRRGGYRHLQSNPITSDYATIDAMQRRHQAGEYNGWTAMGDGILKARELLVGVASDSNDHGYARYGARPTMLVMTDGQTNQKPSNWSLPANFKWKDWTDYDGDGVANYTTSGRQQEVRVLGSHRGHQARHHDPHAGRGERRRPRSDESHRLRRRRRLHQRARRQQRRGDAAATARRLQPNRCEGSCQPNSCTRSSLDDRKLASGH